MTTPTTPEDRIKAAKSVIVEHRVECTGRGEVTCLGCRERGWMGWLNYYQHLAELVTALFPASETVREWVPVACEVADIIRHSEHVKPTSSKTDLHGEYGEPEVYTEWSAIYPSGRELPILREHRWPGSHGEPDPKPCEHLVRTRYAEHVGPWEVAEDA